MSVSQSINPAQVMCAILRGTQDLARNSVFNFLLTLLNKSRRKLHYSAHVVLTLNNPLKEKDTSLRLTTFTRQQDLARLY